MMGAFGYINIPAIFSLQIPDFYLDIRSELIGIGITVLIIDNVSEFSRRQAEKERLILQMGMQERSFSLDAVRQLAIRGWLYDGSLNNAWLYRACLEGAVLEKVLMEKANLGRTNLVNANLKSALLNGAVFWKANVGQFVGGLRGYNRYVERGWKRMRTKESSSWAGW
jgi:hypothetical protein